MKKRFISMLDRTQKRKGGLFVALVLALTLLSGSVLALTPSDGAAVAPMSAEGAPMDTRAVWTRHERPQWLGDPYSMQADFILNTNYDRKTATRALTLTEMQRLFDLYYFYDLYDLRAESPVAVGEQGDAFAIATTLEAYVATVNRDARGVIDFGSYYKKDAVLPFLLLPDTEMTDEELLQLIELDDACALLMPFIDEWALPENAGGELYANRDLTRKESIRYEQVIERYERDPDYRTQLAIADVPSDGLYILGYNGGGETVYHYPEDRMVSDDEFLAMYAEIMKRRGSSAAAQENERYNVEQANPPAGAETVDAQEALRLAQSTYGFDGMRVEQGPEHALYYTDEGEFIDYDTWQIGFVEDAPAGAMGVWHYSVGISSVTGKIESMNVFNTLHQLWEYNGHPLLGFLTGARYAPKNPDDPHWLERAQSFLACPYLHEAQTLSVEPIEEVGELMFLVAYADGTYAQLSLTAENGCPKLYKHMSAQAWERERGLYAGE